MKMQNVVSIDGKYYNITVPEKGIKRSFSVLDTDESGRSTSGDMIRDIIGTYYNYTIMFETKKLNRDEYDELYEVLSAPVDYHVITVPYGQTVLTFNAYVTKGDDTLQHIDGIGNDWSGLSIDFIATSPQRR